MQFNLADLFEIVVDTVPDRLALVAGDERRTYAELDERANRLAHHLLDAGVRPGDKVAIDAWNRAEWIEAELGVYKARAVPVNVNYRYVADEVRYILDNADAVAVVFERSMAPMFAADPGRPAAAAPLRRPRGRQRRALRAAASTTRTRSRPRHPSAASSPAPPTTSTSSTPAAPPACPRA